MKKNGSHTTHVQPVRALTAADYTCEETYKATRLPVSRASTIIPDAYRSEEFYKVEQDRIFSKGWVCVGYTSQASKAGETFMTTLAGQSFFITRDDSGQLRAFYNVCRHRGAQLIHEDGCHDVIRCPYHSWGYGLDGKLLGTPYFRGLDVPQEQQAIFDMSGAKGFCKEDYPLLSVRVESWGCFIFLSLDPGVRPLKEWLGDLPERLKRYPLDELKMVRRKPMEIKANWKLIAENFMEYYHLPWVHPELCNISGFNDHYRTQGEGMYTGMCTYPLSKDPHTASFELPVMPGLDAKESETAYWFLIFPNVALFLLPNHLFTLLFRPDGHGCALENADLLVHPNALGHDGSEKKIDEILNFWDMVNQQDIKAVQWVQAGVQSKAYPGGRMCYRFEEPVHRYQNMVIDRMVGNDRIPKGDATGDPGLAQAIAAEKAVPRKKVGAHARMPKSAMVEA